MRCVLRGVWVRTLGRGGVCITLNVSWFTLGAELGDGLLGVEVALVVGLHFKFNFKYAIT